MATVLHGWTWIGDDEPTVGVEATQGWILPTTGEKWIRNTSNTAWVYDGNVDEARGGAAALSGADFTGPATSPTILPVENPDMLGTPRANGIPLAISTELSAMEKRLYTRLDFLVNEQWLSQSRRSGIASYIAFEKWVTTLTQTQLHVDGLAIPLPTFKSDGVTATVDQLVDYGWAVLGFAWQDESVSGHSKSFKLIEYPSTGSRLLKMPNEAWTGNGWCFDWNQPWTILTWAFAVR